MRQQFVIPALVAGLLIFGSWGLSLVFRGGPATPPPSHTEAGPAQAAPPVATRQAPEFSLAEVMSGKEIKLSDYKGKVVLLDFWATWCKPCRMSIPHFVEMKKDLGEDFEIIGVSLDRKGLEVVKPFVEQFEINYPVVLDSGSVSMAYGGIRSIPTAFVIGRDGAIRETLIGYRPRGVFEQAVKRALQES